MAGRNNFKQDALEFDIVIVGAGLVGASLAAAICASPNCRHLSIAVVDGGSPPKHFDSSHFDPRVVALTRRSQQLFESLGVWSAIETHDSGGHRVCPYTHMHVWDGEGTGQIDFDAHEMHQPNLGFIVENSVLLQQLLAKLETCPRLTVIWGESVTEIDNAELKRVRLSSGKVMTAPLLLAADGANSKVRALCGFPTREWHYGQQAIVTTVKTTRSHQYTAWQRFMRTGPLAFLPLHGPAGNDQHSSIVWSLDDDRAAELMGLADTEFAATLAASFEYKLGAIEAVDRRYSFPLRQRHAKYYVKSGVALLGDAAHTIHPLAGQGVNLGLLDVIALAAEVDRAQQRRIPLDDFSLLRRYQRARLGPNLAMMGLMESFKRLFGSRQPWLQLLRNSSMTQVDSLLLLKNALARQAMGL